MARNAKPEKLVELAVRNWCAKSGWFVKVFDSKAVFSARVGIYKANPNIQMGCPDLLGCTNDGHFVCIELKAPGKESICRKDQYLFLKDAIKSGAFACVISSSERLSEIYSEWGRLRTESQELSQKFLIESLPKKIELKVGKTKRIVHIS